MVLAVGALLATIVVPLGVAVRDATTSDDREPRQCGAPRVTAGASRWAAGTIGARSGFSPGASIFGNDDDVLRREMRAMAAAGARWVRLDLDWSHIGRVPGRLDWCSTDRGMVAARAAGLDVIGLATYTPEWARPAGSTDKHPPLDVSHYGAFVEAAVARYRPIGVRVFELWNEPNISHFWQPRVDPAAYSRLLQAGSAAARRAAADVVVLPAGTAPASDDKDGRSLSAVTFLEGIYAAGGGPAFDAVATHPYTYPQGPLESGTTFARLDRLRAVMEAHGDGAKKIWLTEMGAPTGDAPRAVSEEAQADAVTAVLRRAPTLAWIGPIIWYSYRDSGIDPEDTEANFGLVRRDFDPKRALQAFIDAAGEPDPNPAAAQP